MQPVDNQSIGIIGAGRIGKAIAQIAIRAGRPVVMSNSRGPASLVSVLEELGGGVTAGTVSDIAHPNSASLSGRPRMRGMSIS
jgi:predicted dinucleotide-binding enzyme